jgi:hypothetical protein
MIFSTYLFTVIGPAKSHLEFYKTVLMIDVALEDFIRLDGLQVLLIVLVINLRSR